MIGLFEHIGRYFQLLGRAFSRPEKLSIYYRRVWFEIEALGFNSISLTAITLESPFIPQFMIGYATREVMVLEFSSTVVALILAGKIGSNIASEIGTMRITEQIDALEIMGINSAAYLILPKVLATVMFFPLLTLFSIFVGIVGGYAIGYLTGIMLPGDYIEGLFYCFEPFSITYALVKGSVFAFIITSISAYCGYYAKGNSLEVGRASTRAVVSSSITIMIFDLILTQIMRV